VYVEDSIGESGNELRGQQAHVASQTDQIDVVRAQARGHVCIVLGAGSAFGHKHCVRQPQFSRSGDSRGIRDIRKDHSDFNAREPAFPDRSGDCKEVGAAAGEQDSEAN
jgi:hypothetical protein